MEHDGWQRTAHEYYKPALETGFGLMGGGLGGTASLLDPIPGDEIPAMTAGTGLGISMGLAISNFLDRLTGYREPIYDFGQAVNEVGGQLGEGLGWAILGQKIYEGLSPVAKAISPHAARLGNFMTAEGRPLSRLAGKELTPGEETVRHVIDYAQHAGDEVSPGSTNLWPLLLGVAGPTIEDVFSNPVPQSGGLMDSSPEKRQAFLSAPKPIFRPAPLPDLYGSPLGERPDNNWSINGPNQ